MDFTQRSFIIGSEWLYYKLYTGHKTSDILLTEVLRPLVGELKNNNLIKEWFFIRYADPEHHLRIRFKIQDTKKLGTVVDKIYKSISPWVTNERVWKTQIDTYNREIERYGPDTIQLSERIFYYDSEAIINFLNLIEGDEGEEIRWLFGLQLINHFLDNFKFSFEDKMRLLEELKIAFGREFNMGRNLKSQLDKKYRFHTNKIASFLEIGEMKNPELLPILEILKQRDEGIEKIAKSISQKYKEKNESLFLKNFLPSHIHMSMNRLFKSKNRLNELVCYDFLYRYYRSANAKLRK
ncbi:thiopeptide-type bacteriocin biosynthesis protein [Flagellimonas meridianipacifica]|uniref:Thiopeptide-type bacteriocin biosynthesis protein n=1 Tax=Flagellimonas meridianipacifica TaxID=1080225 RepID=A0A2T0MJ60_9FLAO|nr:thiopeptide-type bacteriocin biosynthesis protein [Allomuricauda pacifica]PRX57536.1 thiopeptide-type bacteriocin biosynthesis protein [Allomuricauda pacifica]